MELLKLPLAFGADAVILKAVTLFERFRDGDAGGDLGHLGVVKRAGVIGLVIDSAAR